MSIENNSPILSEGSPLKVQISEWAKEVLPNGEPWQVELLVRARETIEGNIVKKSAWGMKRGVIPAFKRYEGIWNWDAAFIAVAVSRWNIALAREQIDIIFNEQLSTGALPDVIWADGRVVKDFGKPPVMPWAISILDQRHPDIIFLKHYYPKLFSYEEHWKRDRGGDTDGLFHYGGTNPEYESGWDDAVRWDDGCANLWTIDLNCYMVMLYDAMIIIAERLNQKNDVAIWKIRRNALSSNIEERLWNTASQTYMDYDFSKEKFTGILTPASFMPLFTGTASKNNADCMAKHASDSNGFYPGMPTINYGDSRFSDNYMRGPCWLHTASFALQGLRKYGFSQTADKIRQKILRWCFDAGYPFEFYDAKTGAPGKGAASRFSWSAAFIIELLLDWK